MPTVIWLQESIRAIHSVDDAESLLDRKPRRDKFVKIFLKALSFVAIEALPMPMQNHLHLVHKQHKLAQTRVVHLRRLRSALKIEHLIAVSQ